MHWKSKAAIQAALARIPGGEAMNHRLQWMNGRYTAKRLKERTLEQARKLSKLRPYMHNAVAVEVGTGWELITPLLLHLMGAKYIHTYDHLRHLRSGIPRVVVHQMDPEELSGILCIDASILSEKIEKLRTWADNDILLPRAGIFYRAPADACNTSLGNQSVDLFVSYEVLEHVSEGILNGLVAESKRLLKPTGVAYHAIEPGDHYTRNESHVNHYKYSDRFWSALAQNNISYHNRLCERQFLDVFQSHGAEIIQRQSQSSDRDLAHLRNGFRRDRQFSRFSPEELAVWYSEIMYRFPS